MEGRPDEVPVPPGKGESRPRFIQRLAGLSFKKLFLLSGAVCAGIVLNLAVVAAIVYGAVSMTERPIPARKWPLLDLRAVGLKAGLKTDWNGLVRYQLLVVPRSDDLKAPFDQAVRASRDSIRFIIHFYDKSGFETCTEKVKPQPSVDDKDHYEGLEANDSFNSHCSRSEYKDATSWSLSWTFPPLNATKAADNAHASGPEIGERAAVGVPRSGEVRQAVPDVQKRGQPRAVATVDEAELPDSGHDKVTGFDISSGHLETASGKTFFVYREGEKLTATMWGIPRFGGGQQRIRFVCKKPSDCTLTNTENGQIVHARLLK